MPFLDNLPAKVCPDALQATECTLKNVHGVLQASRTLSQSQNAFLPAHKLRRILVATLPALENTPLMTSDLKVLSNDAIEALIQAEDRQAKLLRWVCHTFEHVASSIKAIHCCFVSCLWCFERIRDN